MKSIRDLWLEYYEHSHVCLSHVIQALTCDFCAHSLKDNLPHNTCQIYVKHHLKNTQMILECQIFDEKALK